MNRTASRVDSNQEEIIRALRQCGASVLPIHTLRKGAPDLLVGLRGINYLLELKDGAKPPSARILTEDEKKWHAAWRGQVVIVKNIEEALAAVGAIETVEVTDG